MKKIMTLLTVMAFALTFGTAFAADNSTITRDMSGTTGGYVILAMENGITVFAVEREAGGLPAEDSGKELYNGITAFDPVPVESWAKGSAAGGLGAEESPMVENGITIFHAGPVSYD